MWSLESTSQAPHLNVCLLSFVDFNKIFYPKKKCSSDYIVPGFNEHLKDLHEKARQCYLQWKASGRSRSDHTHAEMRVSRLQFKYTLRHCRANETMMRADALANALKTKILLHFGRMSKRWPAATFR